MICTVCTFGCADAAQRLVDRLDADAVVADLAGRDQVVEDAEHLRAVVDLRVRAVQLEQVDRAPSRGCAGCGRPRRRGCRGCSPRGSARQPAAGLRGDEDALAPALAAQPRDQPLAAPVAVDVGGVDEVDARVDRRVQRPQRLLVVDGAPGATDRPGAEADRGHLHVGAPELSVLHGILPSGRRRRRRRDVTAPAHAPLTTGAARARCAGPAAGRQQRAQGLGGGPVRRLQLQHHNGDDDREHAVAETPPCAPCSSHAPRSTAAWLVRLRFYCARRRRPT